MENFLVPFQFQSFQTTEAAWDFSKKEYIKMFRMTRRGIGQFLNPESADPQKIIDNIIARNPHIGDLSLPLTVRGKTGQKFEAETYDIWGIYQICIESDLPRAKEFLRRFPTLLEAINAHTIKPPAIGDIKPEILGYIGLPHKEKKYYREQVCAELGWINQKFFRECEKAEKTLHINIVHYRKQRADTGKTKYPELKAAALAIKMQKPEATPTQIAAALKHPAAYKESVKRWLKAA